MLKSVTVINDQGEELCMELTNPWASGQAVINIDGIGAGTANINTTELATVDGSLYNSARRGERNIVLNLSFFKDLIEDSRHDTYKFFRVKSQVQLRFETDTRQVKIDGYVESNEPNIFSEAEDTQISIICPFPYFESAFGEFEEVFSGIESLFEFPFENDSLVERLLLMGEIIGLNEKNIFYTGDAMTGFQIIIHFRVGHDQLGSLIEIYEFDTHDFMQINLADVEKVAKRQIQAGDELIINTEQGHKGAIFVHAGEEFICINALSRDTSWFTLYPGNNRFGFALDTDDFMSKVYFTIKARELYEGV